jgi:hypothetical protein
MLQSSSEHDSQYLTIMVYHSYENNIEVMLLKGDVWHEVTSLYMTECRQVNQPKHSGWQDSGPGDVHASGRSF